MSRIGDLYVGLHAAADRTNRANIVRLLRDSVRTSDTTIRVLDLGCDDGSFSNALATAIDDVEMFGVEIVHRQAQKARSCGVHACVADLAQELPFRAESFDVVHANQVIEHVPSVDLFIAEVRRVLRPGGVALISTENGSAWHNIFAALFGWQIFSLTNVSGKAGAIGNPLALHRNSKPFAESWTHKTIFNYRGLKEIFEVHGFCSVRIAGAGYYPLPAVLGRLDPRHSHFLTLAAQKVKH